MASQRKPKSEKAAPAPEAAEQTPEAAPPPKKRSKLMIVGGALLLAAAGGGMAFYFMQPADSAARAVVPKPPVFMPLEAFTVNLASDGGQMQFMQAGITLKVPEKATADLVKERLPEVRNRMLMVLSAKKAADILPVSGKQKLAAEMAEAIRKVIAPPPAAPRAASKENTTQPEQEQAAPATPVVEQTPPAAPEIEVLFTSFIIQ
jgi:flagellar FliL protein